VLAATVFVACVRVQRSGLAAEAFLTGLNIGAIIANHHEGVVGMVRVPVRPELLQWARTRASLPLGALVRRFPRLDRWERGEERPTLKQLESFAKATHTPVGYLFLQEPPEEHIPIPDFRTALAQNRSRPSPDLLETIYICQQRQEWYRDFARSVGDGPLAFVGSVRVKSSIERTAESIRRALGFDLGARAKMATWTDALRCFIAQADVAGIMVMCSGVVRNNNRRHLDPEEFRGFAMADDLAPLIFINGADTKAAQMFTLAHELAHIWLGQSGVSDAQAAVIPGHEVERWCNQVAAELWQEYGKELGRLLTHEVAAAAAKKVKIPNVCIGLGIKCMAPYEMLRRDRARSVLEARHGGRDGGASPI
jgi:Zn-dependent peptidase ImmA (M78 family)/transcriptional regulator with XRE-family HTH domain